MSAGASASVAASPGHSSADAAAPVPAMSAVVLTPGSWRSIGRTMGCLRDQAVGGAIELVVVGAEGQELLPPGGELAGLHSARTVALPPATRTGARRAAGVRASAASIVAFVEEHAYPSAGWAERLLDAFGRGSWAVGPRVLNANPETLTARADHLISYGRWENAAAGAVDDLPGHNSAYRRDLLLSYGDELPNILQVETLLHWDLRRRGHRLDYEPRARTAHVSVSGAVRWPLKRLLTGRLVAGRRSARWRRRRRLAYALGSPLVPLVRRRRMRSQGAAAAPAVSALALVGLGLEALGEAAGYLVGSGDVERALLHFELERGAGNASGGRK